MRIRQQNQGHYAAPKMSLASRGPAAGLHGQQQNAFGDIQFDRI
jgi:hypothetical protein